MLIEKSGLLFNRKFAIVGFNKPHIKDEKTGKPVAVACRRKVEGGTTCLTFGINKVFIVVIAYRKSKCF